MTPPDRLSAQTRQAMGRLRDLVGFFGHSMLRFYNDNCFQTAASLTYTSLLAIVPLMTIGFAIFSAFPAFSALQTQIQMAIFKNLVPEIGDAILDYLGRFMANAGQMPIFGVVGLAVSAVLLIWTIEGAFATVWRVREPRSYVTRILSFWAVVSLTPLFVGASLSLSSTLWTAVEFAHLDGVAYPLAGFGVLLPLALQLAGCSLLYLIIPNREVFWLDAICGGVVGRRCWKAPRRCSPGTCANTRPTRPSMGRCPPFRFFCSGSTSPGRPCCSARW